MYICLYVYVCRYIYIYINIYACIGIYIYIYDCCTGNLPTSKDPFMKYGSNVLQCISRKNPLYYLWKIWQTRAKLLDTSPDPSLLSNSRATLIQRVLGILNRDYSIDTNSISNYSHCSYNPIHINNRSYSPKSPAPSVPTNYQFNNPVFGRGRSSAHAIS